MLGSKIRTILVKLLDASALRQSVLSDNIANVSTPGFKRSDVTFEAELHRSLERESAESVRAKMTDARHIPFREPSDPSAVKPKVVIDYDTSVLNNKNNVDIDKEMAASAKNTMQYQLLSDLLGKKFRGVNKLLGSG